MHRWKYFTILRYVGSLFPTSFITLYSLTGRDVRLKRTECPGSGHEQTLFLALSWCQWNRQTQLPRSIEATRAVSAWRTIIFFFYAFLPLRAQAFSSGTLPVRVVASMRRTEALASVKFYQMLSIFFSLFVLSPSALVLPPRGLSPRL